MIGEAFDAVLKDARGGAQEAFAVIYRDLAPVVRGLARGKGVSDPDDVASETMVSVARGLNGFTGDEQAFRSWVLTIGYRRIADEFRRRSRTVPTTGLESGSAHNATPSAESVALRGELTPEVTAALDALTADQRDVVLLRVLADLPVIEVARILGKKPGAVKMIQSRALQAMAERLNSKEIDVASQALANDRSS